MRIAGNPRVTPEVTRDVCLLARMMAANLYFSQIEDLMFEVSNMQVIILFFWSSMPVIINHI
jgi:phosphoenolpyruvate carboxylase